MYVFRTKIRTPTTCLDYYVNPDYLHVLYECQAVHIFFFAGNIWYLKTEISQKLRSHFFMEKSKRFANTAEQGLMEHAPNFRVYLEERAWALDA